MATRDAACVVRDALKSVRAQRGVDLELIVVDGSSTDDTLGIVDDFNDLTLQVLAGPDDGVYDAMNKGIAAARGDAFFFLNADDRLAHPDALALLATELCKGNADIVFGNIMVVGPMGDAWRSSRHVTPRSLAFESLSHQSILAHRRAFNAVGTFDTRWRICADLDWLLRCANAGLRLRHLPRLVCHCMTGGLSTREHARHMAELRAIQRSRLPRHWPQWLAAAMRRRIRRLAHDDCV